MTNAIVLYMPPSLAIVPLAPARVIRETAYTRRLHAETYRMPDNYEAQVSYHNYLLSIGYKAVQWEIVA